MGQIWSVFVLLGRKLGSLPNEIQNVAVEWIRKGNTEDVAIGRSFTESITERDMSPDECVCKGILLGLV
jgi:hypothetical protein